MPFFVPPTIIIHRSIVYYILHMIHKSWLIYHILQIIPQRQHKTFLINKKATLGALQIINRIFPRFTEISLSFPVSEPLCSFIPIHIPPVSVSFIKRPVVEIYILFRNSHFNLSVIEKCQQYGHLIRFGH